MTARVHPFPTVATRVLFGAQSDTIAEVLPLNPRLCCDWCGDTGVTLRNVPSGPYARKPCCHECFQEHVNEAREYDFPDWPLSNPKFPANNSHRPQIVPDAPMIEWAEEIEPRPVASIAWLFVEVAAALAVFFALISLLPVRI